MVDLLHHGLFTLEVSELLDLVNLVLVWDEARLMRVTVSALGDVRALDSVIVASGLIHGAGFISDFVVVHVLISINRFSTVASLILHLAGDQDLRSDVDIRPSSLSGNLDSVG